MEVARKLIANRKIRFGLVGIGNTLFNFLILNIMFFAFGQTKIISSIIATLCAVCVSFFLNRNFVFRHHGHSLWQPLMFAAVTLSGVLLVQNSAFALFSWLLNDWSSTLTQQAHTLTGIALSEEFVDINMSNALASLVVMVWNYNGYRLFVFTDKNKLADKVEDEETITLPA